MPRSPSLRHHAPCPQSLCYYHEGQAGRQEILVRNRRDRWPPPKFVLIFLVFVFLPQSPIDPLYPKPARELPLSCRPRAHLEPSNMSPGPPRQTAFGQALSRQSQAPLSDKSHPMRSARALVIANRPRLGLIMMCWLGDSLTGVHPRRISRARGPTTDSHVDCHLAAVIPASAVRTTPVGYSEQALVFLSFQAGRLPLGLGPCTGQHVTWCCRCLFPLMLAAKVKYPRTICGRKLTAGIDLTCTFKRLWT